MMNYVGSISILDRGDAPAQAIIDKNARSLAQRVADETRDELEKVMTRVDNIYESYEASTQALMETQSTLEYVEDIAELEALIKDQIKKKKYQQQVTIFIVGYENVCGQKLRLLQQVNEFFMDNSKSYEEEDWYPKTPDIDLDDCSSKIEESLTTAKELTEKISTINADMVEWLTTYAINKASTKSKKKLESALSKAKDDVKAITDQLKSALLANDEKDDLIQTYLKQLEGKTLEAQKFKAAAEVAKKNVQGLEAKELVYQEELEKRTSAMKQLQEDLRKMQMDASQSKFLSELNSNRLKNKDSETAVKLDELQSVIERHRLELQESKRELEVLHQDQLKALHETHAADLEAMRGEYADMIKKLQDDLLEANSKVEETERLVADATDAADKARQDLLAIQLEGSAGDSRPTTEIESQPPEAEDDGVSRDSSRQKKKLQFDRAKSRSRSRESRPSTKDTRSSKGAPTKVTVTRTTPAAKTATKPSKPESKSPVKPVKETADASIQDEGGDPVSAHAETRQSKRARSTLETVKETDHGAEFEDSYDLADENSWALVPVETIPGRFAQYRKMTIRKLSELEEQLGLTVAKTQRKVTTLKSQFQEHKSKWETERKVLIEQVEQAQKLQTEAEKEADVAMTQLEEFINEQERLEEEEEVKRQEVVKGVSKPVMVSIPTQNDDDESEVVTSSSPKTLTPIQPGAETGAPPPTFVQSEESEHELTNLMQQTDDAKYERQRSDSKAISRRSSSINSDVAPWLLASEKKSLDNDDEDDEETVVRSSASKTSFRTKSEHIASEMSKLEEPDEADEDEENDETDSKLVTDEDKQGTVLSKNSSQERRSVASKRSRKTLSRHTTREETQEVLNSREATPDGDIHVESDQDGQESRSSKIPSQEESERSTSKVTQEKQRSKSKMSATQEESQRSPSQAEETEELEEELVSQSGSHNRSRRGSRQSRSQTRSNMKRRSSLKSVERNESQKSLERNESQKSKISESGTTSRKSTQSRAASRKSNESGVVSRKSEQSGGTPRKSEHEEVHNSLRTSDSDLEEETESVVKDGKLESRKSNSDVLSLRSTQLSKHLTVEEIGHAAEDSVLTERSHGDVELYSEETEYEPIFDVQVVTQEKSDSRRTASQQRMSVSNSLEPSSRSGTQPDPSSPPRSSSQVQVMNARKSSGALSAPPAVEPESETRDKTRSSMSAPRSPPLSRSRGSVVSQYVTRGMTGTTPIEELSEVGSACTRKSRSRSAGSGSCKEWILHVTPRYQSRQGSTVSGHDIMDAFIVEDNLPKCQSSALNNMKSMMEEENMSSVQHRTLESVRSALKTLNEKDQELSDLQLERTITLISLASQLTEESIQLGVLPESVFDAFAEINSRAMSNMSHGEEEFLIDDTPGGELLRPMTQGSVLTEPSITETSSGSLKQLPPLESFLLSSQSRRLTGSRQRSLKMSSASLDNMSKYHDRPRADSNMTLQGPLMTFATMATGGTTRKSSPITPRPKSVTKMLSRSQLSRTKKTDMGLTFGSPEYFEYPGNEEGYLYHGIKVCDHGTSPIFQLILYDNGTSPMYQTQTQIVPKTEEEIRATSALSRASLRKEYRNKLGEVRAAVEDRRTKSPAISIPSQRSLEEDQLIDEDDDDEIPYNDIEDLKREQTMEMGTSPPPGQKSSSKLSPVNADHPIVTEYLRLYEGVVQFRNALSKLMVDRDMLQPSQILEDIDTKKFISSSKLEPQIEGMTHNVYHVFEEILAVLSNILLADREPMVSSLTGGGMMMSRDTTQAVVGPKSAESGRGPTVTRASHHSQFSAKSDVSDRIALRELQEQYDRLQHQLSSDTRKHEEQLRHNTVVMMEMQDTINDLQRELSNLGRSSSRLRPQSDTTSPHGTTDSAIMFTRLDSERNAKIMKRAVNDQKMNTEKYKDALVKMEDYVGLPAQRFAHLVRKYVHHSRMKEIEENVKKSKSLNENVFEILDKMEALQNERAKTWADKMDQMGSERIRLANLLMETLDSIEQESGIFLIKPMYSYRGRDIKDARYGGKLTRPIRPQRNLSPNRENLTSFAPAPTPASNMRMIRGQPVPTTQSMTHETTVPKQEVPRPLEGDEGGISGASLNWVGTTQKQTWSMNSSVVRGDPENFLSSQNPNAMNTPRILELDINRMLIGQNTISSKMTQPGMTEDRLVNASQNNLRSYITVNRPTALPGNARPRSFASSATKEFVPPSSPVSQNTKRVRLSDGDMSRNMTNTPPLPPIGSASTRDIPGEPPRSPPGSSMRQSPPHVQEVISPLK